MNSLFNSCFIGGFGPWYCASACTQMYWTKKHRIGSSGMTQAILQKMWHDHLTRKQTTGRNHVIVVRFGSKFTFGFLLWFTLDHDRFSFFHHLYGVAGPIDHLILPVSS